MALSLVITDSQDGTGIATIAGSDSGSTNTLYRVPWTGQAGVLVPTSVGTRTGNGTIAITGAGYFKWTLTGTVSSASAFAEAYMPITDATLSVQEQLGVAVQTRVIGLNLSGMPSGSVQTNRWTLRRLDGVDTLPCCLIAPFGSNTFPNSMTNTDDIGYPVGVALLDRANGDFRANFSRDTLWQERLLSSLRYQHIAGVPRVINCVPENVSIVNAGAIVDQSEIVSLAVLRFIVRMTRG